MNEIFNGYGANSFFTCYLYLLQFYNKIACPFLSRGPAPTKRLPLGILNHVQICVEILFEIILISLQINLELYWMIPCLHKSITQRSIVGVICIISCKNPIITWETMFILLHRYSYCVYHVLPHSVESKPRIPHPSTHHHHHRHHHHYKRHAFKIMGMLLQVFGQLIYSCVSFTNTD